MIGETLRNARLAKGLTTSQAAMATHIKIQFIEALENEDFAQFAAPIYGKGFIRIYSEYLGINSAPLIEDYKAQCIPVSAPKLGKENHSVIELPDQPEDAEAEEPEKEAWPRFEWPRLNIFRQISLPKEPARLKAAVAEQPVKFVLVALGVVVVLVFLVSGLTQLLRPRDTVRPVKSKAWGTSAIGKEFPAPYVDSDK